MDYNRSDELLDEAVRAGTIRLETFCATYQNLYFVDQGTVSLSSIRRYSDDLQRQLGETRLEALFIDHAGLIRPEHGSGSAYERASATAIGLKQLARDLNVAVFCIVQANRAGNKTDGEPVNLEAARDSGAYEENADFVLAFSNLTEPSGSQPFVKLRLAKNRRGPNVPTTVGFDPLSLKMAERDETRDGQ
jgi:replicative DNA helicase